MTYVACMRYLLSMSATTHSYSYGMTGEAGAEKTKSELLTENHRLIVLHSRKCIVLHDNDRQSGRPTPPHPPPTLNKKQYKMYPHLQTCSSKTIVQQAKWIFCLDINDVSLFPLLSLFLLLFEINAKNIRVVLLVFRRSHVAATATKIVSWERLMRLQRVACSTCKGSSNYFYVLFYLLNTNHATLQI